jgi:hypothetical protein
VREDVQTKRHFEPTKAAVKKELDKLVHNSMLEIHEVSIGDSQFENLYARTFYSWDIYDKYYAEAELTDRLEVMAEEAAEKMRLDEEVRLRKSREMRRQSMMRTKLKNDALEKERAAKEADARAAQEAARKQKEEEARQRKIEVDRVATLRRKEREARENLLKSVRRRDDQFV